jgi:protein-tyrosine-phosphatase
MAVEAMKEKGIDLSAHTSKGFDRVPKADVVVTMGCGDACPYAPGRRIDWDLPDPQGKGIEEVRRIRDEIERRVRALAVELGPEQPPLDGGPPIA